MTDRPNLLFIMADQLRADFLGCAGADFVDTPNIDRLAAKGVRYNRAYSSSPICVPARASLLTGLNAVKNGVTSNGQWLRPDLAACGIRTWPELLDEHGYHTAAIGKMHFYPWDIGMGFRYRSIAEDKRWPYIRDDYYRFLREHGYRKLHGNEHEGYYEHKGAIVNQLPWEYQVDRFVGQETCRFIRTYGDEAPFAMMVGFPGPHCPYDPAPEFLEKYDPEDMPDAVPAVPGDTPKLRAGNISGNKAAWNGADYNEFTESHKKKIRAHYAALVTQIDSEIGQILDALEEQGLLDDTIILFSSDHGDYLGDHDLIGKGSFYESSTRVPLLVRLPDAEGATVCDDLVELGDITSTLLHLGGCEPPDYVDSIPLPQLGIDNQRQRQRVIGMTSGGWMNFDGRWKLHKYATGEVLLFDIEEDPDEQRNLVGDPAHLQKYLELDAELTRQIMRSLSVSHVDKGLDPSNVLWSNENFGKQNWQRTYPNSI